jgi:hypothetical protein
MREEQPLDPPERELAEALGRLELEPPRAWPRQIWYRAGFEAGRRRASAWRAVAAAVTVAACLLLALSFGRAPATAERIVYVSRESPGPARAGVLPQGTPPESANANAYLRLCDALAQQGPDALPAGPTGGGGGDFRPVLPRWPFAPADNLLLPTRPDPRNERG